MLEKEEPPERNIIQFPKRRIVRMPQGHMQREAILSKIKELIRVGMELWAMVSGG